MVSFYLVRNWNMQQLWLPQILFCFWSIML